MTVYFNKARGRWLYDFRAGGKRYANYCLDAAGEPVTSKSAARQAEGVAKRQAAMAPKIPRTEDMTLARVIASMLPQWECQASWVNKQNHVREIVREFGHFPVVEISEAQVLEYIARSKTKPLREWHGGPLRDPNEPAHERFWKEAGRVRAAATINLYLSILRQALERASKMRDPQTGGRVLEDVPHVPELPVPKRKARPMPADVAREVAAIMPTHVIEAMTLSDLFGLRRGEAFRAKRFNIDHDARGLRLFAEDVKDAEDTFMPAGPEAMALLDHLDRQAQARGIEWLIAWRPHRKDHVDQEREPWRPVKIKPSAAWRRAKVFMMQKYGRTWRWHDLRAGFITRVAVQSGSLAAQALARHSDFETTRAYIEVADEFRRNAAEKAGSVPLMVLKGGKS